MASLLSRLRGGSDSAVDPEVEHERNKYRLLVTAGSAYDRSTHKIVKVNTETPTTIENDFMIAKIVVRVKGFRGLPSSSPSTSAEYFADPMHARDQYSLGFTFVPKQDIPSVDTVWGNDFDHPVRDRIPPGFNTAFRIVKEFIDPGLTCDAYADEPWLYGPSLSCWFALRIGEKVEDGHDFPSPGVMHEGADGSGRELRDQLGLPSDNEKRRKYFLDAKNRQSFVFQKGRLYSGDFYNGFLDFGNFALTLPGFSLKVIKYVGDRTHCLRYVFKNRQTGDMYFNVNFTLLWGEELQNALAKDDDELDSNEAISEANPSSKANEQGVGREQPRSSSQPSHLQREASSPTDEMPSTAVPTAMQLHPGDHTAIAQSIGSETNTPPPTTAATTKMQLHPGDHHATAQSISHHTDGTNSPGNQVQTPSSSPDASSVDEIAKLLQQTSTSQRRGGHLLDDVD